VYLEELADVIRERRSQLSRRSFFEFKVGDRVRFNHTVKPYYLIGVTGTITSKKQTKLVFTPDPSQMLGRFRGGPITTPPSLLERVDE